MSEIGENLSRWAERLEAAIVANGIACINRVAVVSEAASTQDAARELAAGRPGLLVIAGRQTAGRGRLGRKWTDEAGLGLAVTFVMEPERARWPHLPIAAGVAACMTVETALGIGGSRVKRAARGAADAARGVAEAAAVLSLDPVAWAAAGIGEFAGPGIGLRWPNDVVAVEPRRPERKVSGVLIEADSAGVAVGIGINVLQYPRHWPDEMREQAASLASLGSRWSRLEVAEQLLIEMDAALREPPDALTRHWQKRDILIGTHRTFEHGGRVYSGRVEAIQPTSEIQVRTDGGEVVKLPALTTSMVHG